MCYRNYERVIPFSMQATLEEAHPAPGIFSKEEMHNRSMLTGQTFQCAMKRLNGVIDT